MDGRSSRSGKGIGISCATWDYEHTVTLLHCWARILYWITPVCLGTRVHQED